MSDMRVAVILSAGRHPMLKRPRAALQDRRALEMALRLDAHVIGLHVGDAENPALPRYLGMGLKCIEVLQTPPDAEIAAPLCRRLADIRPDLILAGVAAETGEGSGLLPHLVARHFSWPLLCDVASLELKKHDLSVTTVAAKGRRQLFEGRLPAVLTVGNGGPEARPFALLRARRGEIAAYAATASQDTARASWRIRPARKRPVPIRAGAQAAATDIPPVTGLSPDAAAAEICNFLQAEGLLPVAAQKKESDNG